MKAAEQIVKRADEIFSTQCYNDMLARGEIENPTEYTLEVHLRYANYTVYPPTTPALVQAILEEIKE